MMKEYREVGVVLNVKPIVDLWFWYDDEGLCITSCWCKHERSQCNILASLSTVIALMIFSSRWWQWFNVLTVVLNSQRVSVGLDMLLKVTSNTVIGSSSEFQGIDCDASSCQTLINHLS